MANETKVGLLVGMSFIVVFALLLANRGSKQTPSIVRRPAATRGELVKPLSVSDVEDRLRTAALGSGDASPVEKQLDKVSPPAPTLKQAEDRPSPKQEDPPPGSSFQRIEEQLRFPPMPKPLENAVAQAPADLSDWKNEGVLESIKDAEPTVLTSRTVETGGTEAEIESKTDPVPSNRQHVVKKGETLYKIARDVYGTSSKDVLDQLYDANRTTLKSPNSLKTGDKLSLPVIEDSTAAPAAVQTPPPVAGKKKIESKTEKQKQEKPVAPADSKAKKGTSKKRTESSSDFRWYQVGKGDRFTTIAAKQMGDIKQWQRLADYNKDIFPDPAKIRPGVRIKIPVKKLASAQ